MNAETAASPGVTEQQQPQQNGAAPAAAPAEANRQPQGQPQEPHAAPIGDRLTRILLAEGVELPPDLAAGAAAQQPTEGQPAHEQQPTQTHPPGSAGTPAGIPGSAGSEQVPGQQTQQPQPQGQQQQPAQPQGQGEELTEQERQQWPPEALARIHKIAARRNQEREARERAETERDQARQLLQQRTAPQPTAAEPLANVTSEQQLAQVVQEQEELQAFATVNPHGAYIVKRPNGQIVSIRKDAYGNPTRQLEQGETIEREYSEEQAAAMRLESDRILRRAVPARAVYLREKTQWDAAAREQFPEMFDDSRPEARIRAQLLHALPEIQRFTDAELWIGRVVRAQLAEMRQHQPPAGQQQQLNGQPPEVQRLLQQQPRQPIAPPVATVRGAPVQTREKQIEAASQRAAEDPSEESGAELIGALRARNGRTAGAALV